MKFFAKFLAVALVAQTSVSYAADVTSPETMEVSSQEKIRIALNEPPFDNNSQWIVPVLDEKGKIVARHRFKDRKRTVRERIVINSSGKVEAYFAEIGKSKFRAEHPKGEETPLIPSDRRRIKLMGQVMQYLKMHHPNITNDAVYELTAKKLTHDTQRGWSELFSTSGYAICFQDRATRQNCVDHNNEWHVIRYAEGVCLALLGANDQDIKQQAAMTNKEKEIVGGYELPERVARIRHTAELALRNSIPPPRP